ncbi:MAG: hypothetical protein FJ276_08675, partial [Planctomycetes bacterium]|nr:hypothetical protein [Planctomycetota bacterium]
MMAPHLARSAFVFVLVTGAIAGAAEPMKADSALSADTCSVLVAGRRLTLASPAFAFTLDTSDGLQAVSWENRLTGRTLTLGSGPEVEFDIGLPDTPVVTPKLRVTRAPDAAKDALGEAVFELTSDEPPATVTVTYRWDAKQPVLRKFVTIANTDKTDWDRLLNVRLGTYRTDAQLSGGELTVHPPSFQNRAHVFGGLQGFPVYADDEFFLSLVHPAGWSTQKPGEISLRHYPGTKLAPGSRRDCLETVYGVGQAGGGREAFVSHVRSRMRRTVRGHDKPYAIFEPFGGRADGNFDESEAFVLDMIRKVGDGQRDSSCRFDLFSVDFWVDYRGDIKRCDPVRFPNDLARIKEELRKLDIALGLWIDSSICGWSVGGNPATHTAIVQDQYRSGFGNTYFCRATEPIRSLYTQAFVHHIRENGARLLKFDNLTTQCQNPQHEHLPGVYSTEAIIDGVIECYRALDAACPDVFIMLYWGYRSPWWLLYGDTMFETGVEMEAASPGHMPAPYVRDGVTRKLDQGHTFARDVPWLGTDSLGVWLSHWGGWNSGIGTERWEQGFVMDICRGHALAQPWSDPQWLSPPERRQMGEFIALMKARPQCFVNSRLILGDPWKDEPYGYCCSDGQRAILAINNGTWEDRVLTLELNAAWGLPNGKTWDLYRWYPNPARLTDKGKTLGPKAEILLRAFEVVLLEALPHGEPPALQRDFQQQSPRIRFTERSQRLKVAVTQPATTQAPLEENNWNLLEIVEAKSNGGATLTPQPDGSILASGQSPSPDTYQVQANTTATGITAILLETLPHDSLPGKGPGRAVNGNYQLSEIRVHAAPTDRSATPHFVTLHKPIADYAQASHGGWPIAAALDGDPKTAWSIDPAEGSPHVALFETTQPLGFTGGTTLSLELLQGDREHALGRFRLWVTDVAEPALPAGYGAPKWIVQGEIPATDSGGLLVVVVELLENGQPVELANLGSFLTAESLVAGAPVAFRPALGPQGYPSSWQAWRHAV